MFCPALSRFNVNWFQIRRVQVQSFGSLALQSSVLALSLVGFGRALFHHSIRFSVRFGSVDQYYRHRHFPMSMIIDEFKS